MEGMVAVQGSLVAMTALFKSQMDEFQRRLQQSSGSPTTSSLASEFSTFRMFILSSLETVQHQIEFLANHVDRLDMRGRRKMILLHGVPEEKGENAASTAFNIVSKKLNVTECCDNSIARAHRLGNQVNNRPRPLLIKFRDVSLRDKVWFSKSKLKGTGITQAEFLTKSRHVTFMKARQRFGVSKCWTRDGIINILAPDGTHHRIEYLLELDAIAGDPVPAPPAPSLPGISKGPVVSKEARVKRLVSKK